MVIRAEYDRFNRYVCTRTTGNRPSHAVAQWANFSIGARPLSPPAGAGTACLYLYFEGKGGEEGREGRARE